MITTTTFVLTALCVLFGATISSMAGFGFGIAIMPFMLLLYPAKVAVALTLVMAGTGSLMQWLRVRRFANYNLVGRLFLGATVGIPLGGYILTVIDAGLLKALIGIAVLAATIIAVTRRPGSDLPQRLPGLPAAIGVGFASGVFATTVSQTGIPLTFLINWTRMEKVTARATMCTFFLMTNALSATTLFFQGSFTGEMAVIGLATMPFYALGLAMGEVGFRRFSQNAYHRLTLVVLCVSAAVGLFNGLRALLG